ncbi:MAG: putative quinol monooxygenase [Gammaproteobacteria bacterium]|jgi:quinol monooxygenase YgiN
MIALIAILTVQAGKEEEFERIMGEVIAAVRADEPGNQLYTLAKDDEGRYHVLEIYADEAALAAHSEHLRTIGAALGSVMGGRPEIKRLTVVA